MSRLVLNPLCCTLYFRRAHRPTKQTEARIYDYSLHTGISGQNFFHCTILHPRGVFLGVQIPQKFQKLSNCSAIYLDIFFMISKIQPKFTFTDMSLLKMYLQQFELKILSTLHLIIRQVNLTILEQNSLCGLEMPKAKNVISLMQFPGCHAGLIPSRSTNFNFFLPRLDS